MKYCCLVLLSFVFTTMLFAKEAPDASKMSSSVQNLTEPSTATGQLVLYRGTSFAGANNQYDIFVDGALITSLPNSSMYTLNCTPGVHRITVLGYPSLSVEITVEAHDLHYIRLGFQPETRVIVPELSVVDNAVAEHELEDERMKNLNKTKKNSLFNGEISRALSFHFGVGAGFKQFDICELSDGSMARFSFGSRVNLGVVYGLRFGNHIEVEGALLYHDCEISPYVEDISASFYGLQLSPTVSFVIPIHGLFDMNLKIGAGVDRYLFNSYKENTWALDGGIKAKWKYEDALGYHARVLYEVLFSPSFSMSYGLEYSNVTFKYNSGDPCWTDYYEPDGSGIQLICRLSYLF
jgi:hypothetical protein